MSNKNIFAAGGCHVGGHLVGMSNSFIAQFLNQNIDADFVGWSRPISVKRALDFFEDRRELLTSDTQIILQLGNFETSKSLVPKFFSLIRASLSSSTSSGVLISHPKQMVGKVYGARPLFYSLFKLPLIFFYELIGRSPFDAEDFEIRLRRLFVLLKEARVKRVVVLTTFFSLHPGLNFYRQRANGIIKELTLEFGFDIIDSYRVTKDIGYLKSLFLGNENFADYEHLSLLGHTKVANELRKIFD